MENEEIRRAGKQFGYGLLIAAANWVVIASLVVAVGGWLLPADRDDTDAPSGPRSGLLLRIDHGTGCQYLETKSGALFPRMSWNGRQICEAPE